MTTNQRPGFMVYFCDWDMPRQLLNPEQFKVFFDAVFSYARDGETPPPFDDRTAQVFFDSFIEKINADNERYQETCRQRSEAAKKSHRKKQPDASNSMQMQANAANNSTTTIPSISTNENTSINKNTITNPNTIYISSNNPINNCDGTIKPIPVMHPDYDSDLDIDDLPFTS